MNPKCTQCGLVNFAAAEECRRCGAYLGAGFAAEDFEGFAEGAGKKRRSLSRKVLSGFALSAFVLAGLHVSLLATSEAVSFDQKRTVERAVGLVERAGFAREAFLLRRLANYRTTDNWWNRRLGHADAYASTNFPFEVLTLYPDFFKYPSDDVERAVILLHEARHLAGDGEEEAFDFVWRNKSRLGWAEEQYGQTRVWKNVNEFTHKYAPQLFRCGEDGQQDCGE
jgi:hypothetical protein